MNKNYYEILGIKEEATKEEIIKAYKIMVKKYHPDLQPEEKRKGAEEKIKGINEAYETLKDEKKKIVYDEMLNQRSYETYFYNKEEENFYYEQGSSKKNKWKKILIWVAILLLLFSLTIEYMGNGILFSLKEETAIEQIDKKYLENYDKTYNLIKNAFDKNDRIIKEYVDVWSQAIRENKELNKAVDIKYYELQKKGILKEIEQNKEQIQKTLLELQYPKESFKVRLSLLLDYYELYLKQYSYAENPRESYKEYTSILKEIESKRRSIEKQIGEARR